MRKLIRFLAIVVILGAVAYLSKEFWGDFRNQRMYDKLKIEVVSDDSMEERTSKKKRMRYSLKHLQEQNADCIGIIEIPDTAIYYPVLYSEREDGFFYMNRNFEKEPEGRGSIFADYRCNYEKPSYNIMLYGHRMRNGQMFADLQYYKEKKYWQEHPKVYYTTTEGTGTYKIFAVYMSADPEVMDEQQKKYQLNFIDGTEEEKQEFIHAVKSWSFYNTKLTPTIDQEILTLRTCDYAVSNGRISVVAYLDEFEPSEEWLEAERGSTVETAESASEADTAEMTDGALEADTAENEPKSVDEISELGVSDEDVPNENAFDESDAALTETTSDEDVLDADATDADISDDDADELILAE